MRVAQFRAALANVVAQDHDEYRDADDDQRRVSGGVQPLGPCEIDNSVDREAGSGHDQHNGAQSMRYPTPPRPDHGTSVCPEWLTQMAEVLD